MEYIKGRDISFSYKVYNEKEDDTQALEVLRGVDIDIREGEFAAILGRNGSGKSTFAMLVNTLIQKNGGTLFVGGLDASKEENFFDIRRNTGMVFQDPDNQIISSVVEEDVAFGPENLGLPTEEIRQRVDKALESVGMSEYAKVAPFELSGGQKQRIAIAGILAMEPKCIIFDESTAMLDPKGRRDVMKQALELNKRGITILLITHYMEEAALAERIFVMEKGRITLKGEPKEIFTQVERMREMGLDVPRMTELSYELRKRGINTDIYTVTPDDMAKALLDMGFTGEKRSEKKCEETEKQTLIEVKNVSYFYGGKNKGKKAVDSLDLKIYENEFLGLIGHTGSGKSTLIQLLNGLLEPDEGSIFFEGKDIFQNKKELFKIRQNIGVVFQYPEYQLFETTIYDEVAFGPKNMGLGQEETDRRVKNALHSVGLDESYFEKSPFALSGGQKRRLAIASILAMEPKVLVLDEPMAGLDPAGRREILSNIKALQRNYGITIVLVSHSMDEVAAVADRILVMNEGKKEMVGSPKEVFENTKRLEEIGLDVPQPTKLSNILKEKGVYMPSDIFSMREAAKYIKSVWRS